MIYCSQTVRIVPACLAIKIEMKGVRAILIIKEVEYAIMILDELYKENLLSAAELSARKNIPSPFIYRVLKKLEAKDILEIRRGAKGGYSLKADCSQLTLYDIICAFDNTFIVTECLKADYECVHNNDILCKVHKYFEQLHLLLKNEFQKNSLEFLLGGRKDCP